MPRVTLKNDREHFDRLLNRFKKVVDNDDVIRIYCDKSFYEKPTTKRKKAKALAIKRAEKKIRDFDNQLIELRIQSKK